MHGATLKIKKKNTFIGEVGVLTDSLSVIRRLGLRSDLSVFRALKK